MGEFCLEATLTLDELKTLIDGDATALDHFNSRRDNECSERCLEIAEKDIVPLRLSEIGVMSLYANPSDAETVLQTIEAVATGGNPIVKRILKFMQPGVPEGSLPDFSLPAIRSALTAPTNLGGLGLTSELAAPILQAAERNKPITPAMVERLRIREGV